MKKVKSLFGILAVLVILTVSVFAAPEMTRVEPLEEQTFEVISSQLASLSASGGMCGDNLTWNYDEVTETLTIDGSGKMYDYVDCYIERVLSDGSCVIVAQNKNDGIDYYREWILSDGSIVIISVDEDSNSDEYYYERMLIDGTVVLVSSEHSYVEVFLSDGSCHLVEDNRPWFEYRCADGKHCVVYNDMTFAEVRLSDGSSKVVQNCLPWMGKNVKTVKIGTDVSSLDESVWNVTSDCLEKYEVNNNNSFYASENGILYSKTGNVLVDCLHCPISNKINDVVIPMGVKTILDSAFSRCLYVESITLPDGLQEIGDYVFENTVISEIKIPSSVKSIGCEAFSLCHMLERVVFNDNSELEVIHDGSFSHCYELKEIRIPDSVKSIGQYAFERCINLKRIDLPEGLMSISDGTFYSCEALETIVVPDSVKSIGYEAFGGCFLLKDFVISAENSQLEEIGAYAFSNCINLETITVPKSVKSIAENWFLDSYESKQKTINIVDLNAWCNIEFSIDSYAAYDEMSYSLAINGTVCENLQIPYSVESINDYAFAGCSSITSVIIPDSVKSIGYEAFFACYNLKNISIPDSITYIDNGAFEFCANLTTITLPDTLKRIGDYTFYCCEKLEGITIPVSVTEVDACAFYGCDSLDNVYYTGTKSQWNQISVDWGNDALKNADICYNYSPIVVVTFDLNDDSGRCEYHTVNYGEYIPTIQDPAREGYKFTGWYANKKCSGEPYIHPNQSSEKTVLWDIILYAGWERTKDFVYGIDTFCFNNDTLSVGKFYMLDKYYNVLTQYASPLDQWICNVNSALPWGGSCYGMSAVMALMKTGDLVPLYFDYNAKCTYDLPWPSTNDNVMSLITFYNFTQMLSELNYKDKVDSWKSTEELSKELVDSFKNKPDEPKLVGIGYKTEDSFGKWLPHEIVAIGMEERSDDYCVRIADPSRLMFQAESGYIPLVEGKLFISKDFSTLSWHENVIVRDDGTALGNPYSTTDNTFKLVHVFEKSEYGYINVQKELSTRRSASLFGETSAVEYVSFDTNYTGFEITDGEKNAVVNANTIDGNLEIDYSRNMLDSTAYSFDLTEKTEYTITPTEELEQYRTAMLYYNENGYYIDTVTTLASICSFSPDGKVTVTSPEANSMKVAVNVTDDSLPWLGITVEATATELTVTPLADGSVNIKSSSSLNGATVTINKGSDEQNIVISEDVTEVALGYILVDEKACFELTGLSESVVEEITYNVVFSTKCASSVESIYGVVYGSTILAPADPEYPGYIFAGWYTDTSYTYAWDFENDTVTENITLYAKWEEDPDYYHTVSFDDNGRISQIVVVNETGLSEEDYPELLGKIYRKGKWENVDLSSITSDITVSAVYEDIIHIDNVYEGGDGIHVNVQGDINECLNSSVVFASYDDDGRLFDIKFESLCNIEDDEIVSDVDLSSCEYIRVFVLGEEYIPLCEYVDLYIE